ncbi:MAG: hypothetical protein ACPG51_17875 [Thiolinea sp.]
MLSQLSGYGQSFASFGEIVQGRLSGGDDFLVTLPVDLWSSCHLTCSPVSGQSVINTSFAKSKALTKQLLREFGLEHGVKLDLSFSRSIPIGKGLSSSTADMLAVVRAFQEAFNIMIPEEHISRLFSRIEPHDALHYPMSTIYNHRQGKVLKELGYIPDFTIVAVDSGGELSTVEYNKNLSYTPQLMHSYDQLYAELITAFAKYDDVAIARCAQRSTELHAERTGNQFLLNLLQKSSAMDIAGILTAHSGTCAGLLLLGDVSGDTIRSLTLEVSELGHVFCTRSLPMPL